MGRIDDSLLNRFKKKLINLTLGASDYSASTAYAVGAFCLHGNNLYECNTAITTGEAWNSAKWTKTTVFVAITKNRNAINELNSNIDWVNNVLKNTKYTFTLLFSFSAIDINDITRYGNVVSVSFRGCLSQVVDGQNWVLDLPESITPATNTFFEIYTNRYDMNTNKFGYINRNHLVMDTIPSGTWVSFCFSFVCI